MNSHEIIEILKARFGQQILAAFPTEAGATDKHPRVHVAAGGLVDVLDSIEAAGNG